TGPWTSLNLFWFPLNDLWNAQALNRSIVRGTSAYLGINVSASMPAYDYEGANGFTTANGTFVNQSRLFRAAIGPFLSGDCTYVALPQALALAFKTLVDALFNQLAVSPELYRHFTSIGSATMTLVPPGWSGHTYYGGNPLCVTGVASSFVQQSFDFFDDCNTPVPLAVNVEPVSTMFSLATIPSVSVADVCAHTAPEAACTKLLTVAKDVHRQLAWPSILATNMTAATSLISAGNFGLMQFAMAANGSWTLLQQPLVDGSSFDFFGRHFLFDWVMGHREVVSFQGDNGVLSLISRVYDPQLYPTGTQPLENATQILFYLVVATTVVLVAVGVGAGLLASLVHLRFRGRNLFFFHRVAGSVWIGRPLAFLRGITAVLLLSSANTALITTNDLTHLVAAPRPWFESLVIAGEATWLTYVANEVLLIFTHELSVYYSPISSCVSWIIVFAVERANPVVITGALVRDCYGINVDFGVECASGSITVGSFERWCMVGLVQLSVIALSLLLCFAFRRNYLHWREKITHDTLLITGISKAFVWTSSPAACDKGYVIDYVACVLSGLIPLWYKRQAYTFDLKLWLLLADTLSAEKGVKVLTCPPQRTCEWPNKADMVKCS
ncbi:hypothetical protein ACHHYP_00087, partial [Achlya hypogyna]